MSTEQTTTPDPADGVESGDPDPAALIGRTDDWWVGYSAGCEASHAAGCSSVEAERDHLREQLERCEVMGEQRITDLQAEFARTDKIRDRQLEATRATARAALAAAASSAPPTDIPARLREATAAVERVRDDMTSHPGAYRQVIDALTLLGRWLAADPEDPAAQAVARALASPTTEETRTDV